jgi:hypothetical protein
MPSFVTCPDSVNITTCKSEHVKLDILVSMTDRSLSFLWSPFFSMIQIISMTDLYIHDMLMS